MNLPVPDRNPVLSPHIVAGEVESRERTLWAINSSWCRSRRWRTDRNNQRRRNPACLRRQAIRVLIEVDLLPQSAVCLLWFSYFGALFAIWLFSYLCSCWSSTDIEREACIEVDAYFGVGGKCSRFACLRVCIYEESSDKQCACKYASYYEVARAHWFSVSVCEKSMYTLFTPHSMYQAIARYMERCV